MRVRSTGRSARSAASDGRRDFPAPYARAGECKASRTDGRNLRAEAAGFIKPNDRLSSFERLEIYNRQYWFRLLDCLYEDYPGLLAVLGERKFLKLATAYLARYPSDSFALRDLGSRLEMFLREEPQWSAPREALALDMVRFEWAQVVAFDGPCEAADHDRRNPRHAAWKAATGASALPELARLFATRWMISSSPSRSGRPTGLRAEASNAVESGSESRRHARSACACRLAPDIHLAVHRHDNRLYFKRLEPEAFAILSALEPTA